MKLSHCVLSIFFLCIDIAVGFTLTSTRHTKAAGRSCASGDTSCNSAFLTELHATVSSRRVALATVLATFTLPVLPQLAVAKDELFRPNPLTNPVLEQIRIWDQNFADEIKYNGELEKGDAGNKGKVEAYPRLLVPIIEMSNDINKIHDLVAVGSATTMSINRESYKTAREILSQSKYDTIPFKKIFNAYGDNIYYSDPDRANAYLGGGAVPKNDQTLAYLLRNDLLNNIQNLQAELDYLLTPTTTDGNEDLVLYAKACKTAMDKYLTLVPPNEMKQALEIIGNV